MSRSLIIVLFCAAVSLQACRSVDLEPSGFLTTYDNLERVDSDLFFHRNPEVERRAYPRAILDPITWNLGEEDEQRITDDERRELTDYANDALTRVLGEHFELVSSPGPGTGRLRLALTDIARSRPLLNILPHTRIAGVGRGGAAAEGEFVDSRTGEQIFAGIRRSSGRFFSTSGFTPLSDIKAAIDSWAEGVGERCEAWKSADDA